MLKFKNLSWLDLSREEKMKLGPNIMEGITPEVVQFGDEEVTYEIRGDFGEHNLMHSTDKNYIMGHVDFRGAPFALTYDIGRTVPVDTVCISSYPSDSAEADFCINDYEIYASLDKDSLYNPESLVHKYYRSEKELKVNLPDFLFSVEGECRYFGLKLIGTCLHTEKIARIGLIGLYYIENKIANNFLDYLDDALALPTNLEIEGDYSGTIEDLMSTQTLNDEKVLTAKSDISLIFGTDGKVSKIPYIYLYGKNIEISEISIDGKTLPVEFDSTESYSGRTLYKVKTNNCKGEKLKVTLKAGAVLDAAVYCSALRYAVVKTSDISDKNFIGGGANVIPTAFSDYGLREGYNEVFWEMEKHHIEKSRPHCVRMWFQIDWIVDTEEQYLNGDWQFDTQDMYSVKKFCEVFRDSGTEIELNFGWKIGTKIQDWFAMSGIKFNDLSAPADLRNYGKACAALLEHLIIDCGFDNIKYVTFYNEPHARKNPDRADFLCPGDPIAYWASMLKYAKYYVEHSKVRDMVEFWACEESGWHDEAMQRINILAPNDFTTHTIHKYLMTYRDICEFYDKEIVPNKDGKPVVLTEFGNSCRNHISWDKNHINNIMAGATHGVSGAFIWILQGAPLVDPLNWMHAGSNSDGGYSLWTFLPIASDLNDAGESFYEFSLINNYIPFHAVSFYCDTDDIYEDFRINAFYKDGEYTVCVESKGEYETDVNIRFDKDINRKFYRHTYRLHKKSEGNLIIPPVDKVIEVSDRITDKIDREYSFTVYTTIKPVRQVVMDECDIRVSAGTRVPFGATVLDDESNQEISYSISKSLIAGAEIVGNEVVIPETAKAGDMLALKADLPTGEFGISIIRVI